MQALLVMLGQAFAMSRKMLTSKAVESSENNATLRGLGS